MKIKPGLKFLFAVFMLVLASLACALGGPPAIGDVVTAKSLDADYKPVDPVSTYGSDDTIYVSVQVENLKVGSVVAVKYKFGDTPYEETTITADEDGSGYYGFKLSTNGGHPPGKYAAEVYLDDKLTKTVDFEVEASGPPSIGAVITAKELDADYKPVDPTTVFAPTDIFYVSVEVKNLVNGSVVTIKYKFEGEDYGDTSLTADQFGSGHYGFNLTPASEHPVGKYTAEIYLDDKLAETVEFEVR